MVFSSSYLYAKENFGSSTYFFIKQIIYCIVGVGVCLVVSKTRPQFWIKYSSYINLVACFLLILTFVPGVSVIAKGANRWIYIAGLSLQPGEFVKYSMILHAIFYFENFFDFSLKQKLLHGASLTLPMGLLLLQPDFGTFFICCFIIVVVCYLGSFPKKFLYYGIGVFSVIVPVIMLSSPYRVKRLLAFMDPWKQAKGTGFQVIQSYLAFAHGSWFGQGLGNSNEKLFYLPEAHNDFIFSVVGEEMGLIGVFLVIALFMTFIYLGLKLAASLKEKWGYLLIATIIITLGFQALLNMGVVLGLLPTKGLNLPFISYGGSSLVSNFFGIGIILSVVRQVAKGEYSIYCTSEKI